ncbi:tetrahydrofolate synthase [Malassezia sp. CBS 17886]|nr:tetrahydrofolate synthase [Malassezia sp. CBS 17886]
MTSITVPPRTYAAAIDALNSLQSNAATIEAIRRSGRTVNELNEPEMLEYLSRIGHRVRAQRTTPAHMQLEDLDALHVTHRCLLTAGLYTSPHMVAARERIRIDGKPIAEDAFAKYFWEVWERLGANPGRRLSTTLLRPVYFRFMTLLAFHVFISERVAATILEVGIGGMYDSTNIVSHPVAAGITALGLDHTAILGNTLEEIARQKAGIFKRGAPALTVEQPPAGMQAVRAYAEEVKACPFDVVPINAAVASTPLGLRGTHQQANASLALALVRTLAESAQGRRALPGMADRLTPPTPDTLSDAARTGLAQAFWPGRCQVVPSRDAHEPAYFLDGAHTTESLAMCARWFVKEADTGKEAGGDGGQETVAAHSSAGGRPPRALIFNCTNGRSANVLLHSVLDGLQTELDLIHPSAPSGGCAANACTFFHRVYFCTNNTYMSGDSRSDLQSRTVDAHDLAALTVQQDLLRAWCSLLHVDAPAAPREGASVDEIQATLQADTGEGTHAYAVPSIEHATAAVRKLEQPCVLVTGSLHLVGGVMAHLQADGRLDECLQSGGAA